MNDQACSSGPRNGGAQTDSLSELLKRWMRVLRTRESEVSARDTLEELIEEREEEEIPINADERRLLANILELRDREVQDVMVPRPDIVAVDVDTGLADLVRTMTDQAHSRIPVYRESLDDALGMVHIKDVLAWRGRDDEFQLSKILRRVLFVSPFMRVLELLLEMRTERCHMALVVDEFGGVDGLVTIEDLVEEIVGEIQDEHDKSHDPVLVRRGDGSWDADARVEIEDLEEALGPFVSEDERDEIDTVGGLVFALAGHVPVRGELVPHPSGLEFEVLDADPRHIRRLRVRRKTSAGSGDGVS